MARVLVDTNVLVAAARPDDDLHLQAAPLLRSLRADADQLLIPPTVVAEVCYMLSTWGGAGSEAAFLRSFGGRGLELAELHETDLARIADLVEQYADLGLGGTDASIIALAERLGIERVATFDRRHFSVVRPAHVEALTLLP